MHDVSVPEAAGNSLPSRVGDSIFGAFELYVSAQNPTKSASKLGGALILRPGQRSTEPSLAKWAKWYSFGPLQDSEAPKAASGIVLLCIASQQKLPVS